MTEFIETIKNNTKTQKDIEIFKRIIQNTAIDGKKSDTTQKNLC